MPLLAFLLLQAFDALFRQGLEALRDNRYEAAAKSLEEASRAEPNRAEVWLALARTYSRLGRAADAAASAERSAKLAQPGAPALHGLAMYFSEQNEFGRAAAVEARYAQGRPKDAAARATAASLYLKARDAAQAVKQARQALAIEDQPAVRVLLAQALAGSGDSAGALAELRTAAKRDAYEEANYFAVAQALLDVQKFDAALEAIDEGRKVFDKSPQLELARGVALYGLRRFPDAAGAFLRTIRLDSSVPQPFVFLGRMVEVLGPQLGEVTEVFRGFAESHPADPLAQFVYAKALAAGSGDAEKIEQLLRRSLELREGWEAHFELGLLLERKRQFEAAAGELERAVAMQPSAATPHYRLARVYDRLGRREDAARERALHVKLSSAAPDPSPMK